MAVYAAPRGTTDLGRLATAWLGRDIDGGDPATIERPQLDDVDIDEITDEARLYGFHGTLKPPFRLADAVEVAEVDRAVAALAAEREPVLVDTLVVDVLAGFVALRPEEPNAALADLAAACVRDLDRFRRPADELEVARRRRARLSPAQERYLIEWGYPYVLDEFRYHMTLSRRMRDVERDRVVSAAQAWFAPHDGAPFLIDELCLVEQTAPGEPFVVRARHRLGAAPTTGTADQR